MKFESYLEKSKIDFLFSPEIDEIDRMLGFKEVVHELSMHADFVPQEWGDIDSTQGNLNVQAEKIYKKAKAMALQVKNKFLSLLKRSSQFPKVKILVDIKGLESFVDKAVNRYPLQGKGASDITDVLRSAILVKTQAEVEKTVKNIKKYFTVAKHKEKIEGNDPAYGYYGSHHFYVKVGNIFSEIQVMTRKLWSYKDAAHKIYNKYRSMKDADDRVKKMDIELSKMIFKTANKEKKFGRKKGKPQLKKHKKWKFDRNKLEY